eukprot:gene592-1145_t
MLLSSNQNQSILASSAGAQIKAWEQILSIRITLQRTIDLVHKLPNLHDFGLLCDSNDDIKDAKSTLSNTMGVLSDNMISLLESQSEKITNKNMDRKRVRDPNPTWERLSRADQMLESRWRSVVNTHHARLHFGSEQAQSKLKVLNQSLWDQIDNVLTDQNRTVQKSRMPFADCPKRIGGSCDSNMASKRMKTSESNSNETNPIQNDDNIPLQYDEETYDDRVFYGMLLKTFISSGSTAESSKEELQQALKSQKINKPGSSTIDRRASKGRKIRYTVHKKLENFMFPIPPPQSSLEATGLFASLFQ